MNPRLLGKFAEAASAQIDVGDAFEMAHGPVENSIFKDPVTPAVTNTVSVPVGPGSRR